MHNKDIYCIIVSLISGVQMIKTRNFDCLADGGFGFHNQFVPVPRIRKETLEKPIVLGSKTYFFGFDPEKLVKIADTAKRDLEEEIRSETARLNTMSRKLASDYSEVAKTAVIEMQAVKANGGPPTISIDPSTPVAKPSVQATPVPKPVSAEPSKAQAPQAPSSAPVTPQVTPVKAGKTTLVFSVYLAGARGTNNLRIEASGYYGAVKDVQSGKTAEFCGAGDCATVARAELAALCTVFEQYPFPPSSTVQECVITIHTPTEYLANMFIKGILKRYSTNGWKKKDGQQPQNLDLLQSIWDKGKQFTIKGEIISHEEASHVHCVMRAKEEGAKFHQEAYGLISPGGKRGT